MTLKDIYGIETNEAKRNMDANLNADVCEIVRTYRGDIIQDATLGFDGSRLTTVHDASTPYSFTYGKVEQHAGYYPYGTPWREPSGQPWLYGGKERMCDIMGHKVYEGDIYGETYVPLSDAKGKMLILRIDDPDAQPLIEKIVVK